MDQLKPVLSAIRQHSFWIMCVGILLVSLGSWWYSTSQLAAVREANEGKIKSAKSALETLRATQNHPNEATKQGMELRLTVAKTEVADAWSKQYELQREVLVWPQSFDEEFRSTMDAYRPIEKLQYPTPITDEINVGLRRIYRDFIAEVLPSLAETIGSEWKADSSKAGFGGGDAGGAAFQPDVAAVPFGEAGQNPQQVVDRSVVAWSAQSQQELLGTHFGFTTKVDAPTTLQVLYAQEDLWVFQALMNIIAATNDGAEARHDAAIKAIDTLRIGRNALGFTGQVTQIGTPAGGTGVPGMPGGPMGDPTMAAAIPADAGAGGAMGIPGAEGGTGAATMSNDPAEGRYVDDKFMPVPASRLRQALSPDNSNPEDALLAVAKRMPVRMRFMMDQRKLNRLLTECGNSKLPLEVRQVRINRPAGQPSGGAGFGGGMGGDPGMMIPGAQGGGAEAAMGMPGGGGMGGNTNRNLISDSTIDMNVLPVEVYGVVYIYNPVNKKQLGIQDPPPEATVDASAPVAPGAGPVPVSPTSTTATPAAVN